MNLVFITPECYPFTRESGLSDLVFALAKSVEKAGHNVKVFLPRYGSIDPIECLIERLPNEICVDLNHSTTQAITYKGILKDSLVSVFLIDSQTYFSNSKEVYINEKTDIERFNFFAKASLDLITQFKFSADIIHCFNPFTATCGDILESHSRFSQLKNKTGVIFTLYNPINLSSELLNQTAKMINFSNYTTIITNGYLNSLLKVHDAIRNSLIKKKDHIKGIMPIFDMDIYNPESDNDIAQAYSSSYFSLGKRKCKEDLLDFCDSEQNLHIPLIGVITNLTKEEGADVLLASIPDLATLNLQLIIIGRGNADLEKDFLSMNQKFSNIKYYPTNDYEFTRKIYSGSDFFLSCGNSENSGMKVLIAMRYGSVPIVLNTPSISEIAFDVEKEFGNSFVFNVKDKESLYKTVARALNEYKNKQNFQKIVKQAMQFNTSNDTVAKEYLNLYELSSVKAKL